MFRRAVLLSLSAAALALIVPAAKAQFPYRPTAPYRPGCVTPIVVRYPTFPTLPYLPAVDPMPQAPVNPTPAPPVQATPYFVKFKLFGAVQQQVFQDHEAAHDFEERLEALGVPVQVQHGQGVYAVRYSCPQWKVMEFADHEHAHELEEWLTSIGFDAYVKHLR
jgi:hypothetical protein